MRDEIQTDRLVLRPLRASDAEGLFVYRGDLEVARFQSWEPQSLDELRAFIAEQRDGRPDEPGWSQLAIADAATGALLGDLGIHILESDPRQVELGFTLAPHVQRRVPGARRADERGQLDLRIGHGLDQLVRRDLRVVMDGLTAGSRDVLGVRGQAGQRLN